MMAGGIAVPLPNTQEPKPFDSFVLLYTISVEYFENLTRSVIKEILSIPKLI
jgi:hypothetical protein